MQDLKRRTIVAFLWGAGGTAIRVMIQIVSQIILARLLGPEQYGLFATGLVVIFFTNLIADAGLVYGIVQKEQVTDEDIRFIFTWQMALSGLIALALVVGAPLIASAFGDARVTSVVRYLSVSAVLTAFGATAGSLLRRRIDFRTLNIAAVASYAIAFLGIGLPLAFAGFQVLSLVAAFLSQSAISSVILYAAVRHPVRPLAWYGGAPQVLNFGATVFATNIVNWVMSSLDRAIVSSMLGVTAAGLYATVSNLISVPALSLLSTLQPVFYAASSNVQNNVESLRKGLRAMLAAVVLFVAPVFVSVSVAAGTVVSALLGSKWAGGEAVLAPLALSVPAVLLMGLSTPVLWTAGYPRLEFQLQLPLSIIWALVCFGAARLGSLPLVAWVVAALYFIRAAVLVSYTMRAVSLKGRDVVPMLAPGLLVTVLVAAVAFLADRGLALEGADPASRLALVIAACGFTMLAALLAVHPHLPEELQDLLSRLARMIPVGSIEQAVGRLRRG